MFQVNMDQFGLGPDGRFTRAYQTVNAKPSWVWQITLTAGVIIFIVPLFLLALIALTTMILVYVILSLVNNVLQLFSGGRPTSPKAPEEDGRVNVKVIRHD